MCNQERQQHSLLQSLLGGEARTTIEVNEKTNELDVVHSVSSFCTDDDEDRCHQKDKYKHHDDQEVRRRNRTCSAAAKGLTWAPISCCFGCYHAVVTVSWLLLSLLLTSQWTIFVYYPRVHGNNNNHIMRAPDSSSITSTTLLSILHSMNEHDLRVVALAFCLYSLTLGILGWIGICLYHRHLYKQQQRQRQHANNKWYEKNNDPDQQQQKQQQIYLRRSATAILVVLNIALVLLLFDKKRLALVAMITCLVALLWSFATISCLNNNQDDDDDIAATEKHYQRNTTTAAPPLFTCIVV